MKVIKICSQSQFQFAVRVGYVGTIRISRENNNIIQIDLPDGSTKLSMFIWAMFGVLGV